MAQNAQDDTPDPAAWGLPDFAFEPLEGGARNIVLRGRGAGERFVFKTTKRNEAQIGWLTLVRARLRGAGIVLAFPERTLSGDWSHNGWTMERFVGARAPRRGDAIRLRATIRRMHRAAFGIAQRPGFLCARALIHEDVGGDVDLRALPAPLRSQIRAAFAEIPSQPMTLVHGDLTETNLGVVPSGQFVLYDWDEARVDHPLFDLVAIGAIRHGVPQRAVHAFELATAWLREPQYAKRLLERFARD